MDPANTNALTRGSSDNASTASAMSFSPTNGIVSTLILSPRMLCLSASVIAPSATCDTCAPPPNISTRFP